MGGVSVLRLLASTAIAEEIITTEQLLMTSSPLEAVSGDVQSLAANAWRHVQGVAKNRRHMQTLLAQEDDDIEFEESNSLRSLAYATIGQAYLDYEHGLTRAANMLSTNNKKFADKMINDYKSAESFMYPKGTYQEEKTLFILELAHLYKRQFVLANLTLSARLGRSIPAGTLPSWTTVE